jgi:predicted phage tail protein
MWRVTWQTGVAYLIFGAVYLSAYRTLVTPDWNGWSVATLAATGVLGWSLLLTGVSFLIAVVAKRMRRASTETSA